jgi:hypothetical protein
MKGGGRRRVFVLGAYSVGLAPGSVPLPCLVFAPTGNFLVQIGSLLTSKLCAPSWRAPPLITSEAFASDNLAA